MLVQTREFARSLGKENDEIERSALHFLHSAIRLSGLEILEGRSLGCFW